jgi:hypothetical protein
LDQRDILLQKQLVDLFAKKKKKKKDRGKSGGDVSADVMAAFRNCSTALGIRAHR